MRTHYQETRMRPQRIEGAAAAALPSPTPQTAIQSIALDRLALSPGGRRNISRQSIEALAARIRANGQVQSLMVTLTENRQYYVVAGERRFAALRLLAKQKRISAKFPVPCRIIEGKATSKNNMADDPDLSAAPAPDERRRRFLDLRNHCPGLLTGSEFAARECYG